MLAALMFSVALAGQTQSGVDRDCLDDNLENRCEPAAQARVRTLMGVASIEDEAAAGAEVYRAFFVDGYGADMPVVAFERRRGRSPEAAVYGREGRTLRAPISSDLWTRIRSEATFADRQLVEPEALPRPAGSPLPLSGRCLHSWVQTVEMANSEISRGRIEPVRRRTEDGCGGALTTRFAFFLATEAVKAIPPCDVLDEARQRSVVNLLATCIALEGDRLAAAELMNFRPTGHPRYGLDQKDPGVWKAWLGTNGRPTLNWAGEVVRTEQLHDKTVPAYIVARLAEHPNLTFTPRTYEGVNSREAVIKGEARYMDAGGSRSAPYRQVWVWDSNLNDWMVSLWTVEPFTPVP